jgi:hypothetical protein
LWLFLILFEGEWYWDHSQPDRIHDATYNEMLKTPMKSIYKILRINSKCSKKATTSSKHEFHFNNEESKTLFPKRNTLESKKPFTMAKLP